MAARLAEAGYDVDALLVVARIRRTHVGVSETLRVLPSHELTPKCRAKIVKMIEKYEAADGSLGTEDYHSNVLTAWRRNGEASSSGVGSSGDESPELIS